MSDSPEQTRKKQKIILIGGIGLFAALLICGMWLSDPNKNKPTPMEEARATESVVNKSYADAGSNVDTEDRWVAKSEQALASNTEVTAATAQKNTELEQKLDSLERMVKALSEEKARQDSASGQEGDSDLTTADLGHRALPSIDGNDGASSPVYPPVPSHSVSQNFAENALPPTPPSVQQANVENNGIFEVTLDDNDESGEKNIVKKSDHFIPTGSFVTAVMLAGVDAPTGGLAQTNPAPVLFRLKEDARLPNFFRSEIKECLIVGAGAGDLSSERVNIRLETMSCVLANGDVFERKVKGWVTGEDGKSGIRGRVVSKQGRLIAMAALSGIASGLGASVDSQYTQTSTSALGTVQTVDPNKVVESGLAKGFSNSMTTISDYYIKRADETYPIIEVSAKRVVEVVFNEGVDFGRLAVDGNTLSH